MKKILFPALMCLWLLSACNMGAATPAALKQPEVALASPTLLPTQIPPTFTQIPALAPTSTLILSSPTSGVQAVIVPTSTPPPPPQTLPSNVIQFAAGGTWKDTVDSVPNGGSKTYTLNAMQGQVMSVSITGGYFPLRIQGRDGTLLCPVDVNSECSFWRGTLPLTQDYYITVNSGGMESKFTLRVAINPPGKAEQFFTYQSDKVSLNYADYFAPGKTLSMLNHKIAPQLSLQLIDTSSYVNTNLGEAYFSFGVSADPQIVSACTGTNPNGMPEVAGGSAAFNGYNFTYSSLADAGAGNLYEQHIYRALYNNACYEAIYFIHSANIGNFSPGVVQEFDRQGLLNKFNALLSSIQLK